ncbi:MAG TPA: Ig-like domain-containing protein [Roseovarius sp.]
MKKFAQLGAALALALLPAIAPTSAEALGGGFFDTTFSPAGLTCNFNAYHDFVAQETQLNLIVPGLQSQSSGGNYWAGGAIMPWPGGDILAGSLESACGLTNVTNLVSDGANGTYGTDDFVGVRFRGTANSNGLTYDYEIGASGVSTTVFVNTRAQVLNTAPSANAGADQTVGPAATVTLTGAASDANDVGQTLTYAWTQTGGPAVALAGAMTVTPGFTAPTLVAGAPDAALVFSLVVNDGIEDSAADTVLITVTSPANTPPTANAGPDQTVASASAVALDGTGSDANNAGQTLSYAWSQTSGPAVVLTGGTTASPGFTAPALVPGAPDAVVVFSLVVNDGIVASGADSVSVTVTAPANTAPTADAGPDQSVASAAAVSLTGAGSDPNDAGQTLTYVWTQTGGPSVTLSGATTSSPGFTAPTLIVGAPDAALAFSLVVNDGITGSTPDTVTIAVSAPPNTPATANAGPDQSVASGAAGSLDGSESAANDPGQSLTYAWTQIGGPAVTLTGAGTATPGFAAPVLIAGAPDATLIFSLTVNDGVADSAADTVSVTVTAPANTAPTANAGPDQTVASAAPVTLTGAGSDANDAGQTLTYVWTQTGGPAVTLTGAATANPGFTAPTLIAGAPDASLTFSLVVNDGIADSVVDIVAITVTSAPNTPATADAGPDQTVASAAAVTLTGAGSAANDAGQTLTYAWTQTGGPAVALAGAATVSPGFVAPTLVAGAPDAVLVFSLTVNDGVTDSAPDTVSITVTSLPNTAPAANAGPDQTVASAAAVALDGTGSDANDAGQTLTYAWTQTSGPAVTLTGATTASPGFAAPTLAPGAPDATLVFSLTVNDGVENSGADAVSITVTAPANTAPTANAGPDQTVQSATAVALDGSGSTANDAGQTLSYAWTQTGGPAVTLADGATAAPGFTAPTIAIGDPDAVLTFSLIVNDGIENAPADTVQITVTAPANTAPTADAGPDQSVASAAAVTLNGSGSDANNPGQSVTYAWTQTGGAAVTLAGGTTATPSFTAPVLAFNAADEVLIFSLIVNDGLAASPADSVTITVTAPVDVTSPTVAIADVPPSFVPGTPFAITVAFSEPVTGFAAGDITVVNGAVAGLIGAGAIYTAQITPSDTSPIDISIPAGVANDAATNLNLASAVVTVAPDTTRIAQEAIVDALAARGRALIGAQPKLRGFFGASGISGFTMNFAEERGQFRFGFDGNDSRLWMLAQGQWSSLDTTDLDYFHLALGGHLYRSDTLILGGMLQFDDADATLASGTFEGQGWLLGPYVVARLPDQPLIFSASLLHGQTDNTLSLIDQAPDGFSSTRTLFTAGVEGRLALDNGLTLIPSLDLAHVMDRQETYVDSLANTVSGQTVRLTETSLGLGFEQSFRLSNSDLLLTGGISGIHSDLSAPGDTENTVRGRLDLGAEVAIGPRTSFGILAYYDGIGSNDYEATGAALVFEMEF